MSDLIDILTTASELAEKLELDIVSVSVRTRTVDGIYPHISIQTRGGKTTRLDAVRLAAVERIRDSGLDAIRGVYRGRTVEVF